MAKGVNLLGLARGAIVMSNIFLSTAFIYLASEESGCVDDEGAVMEDCDGQVYGFKPASLIANIAVISGLLSAFLMPVTGAIVDYTPHRRNAGIIAAVLIAIIQGVQIALFSNTWFPMMILQAIAGFLYQVEVLSTYAYLPDIARIVGEKTMTRHTATFVMSQFSSQASFLLVVVVLSIVLEFDDVMTARVSQGINVVWIAIFFSAGWYFIPAVPAAHDLPEGRSLFTQGFVQIIQTTKKINRDYSSGLRWYLISIVFAEAAANTFTTVSVVFLDDQIGMTGTQIGIFFLVTLIGTLPGSCFGSFITKHTNPNTSFKMSMGALVVVSVVGVLSLGRDNLIPVFIWGVAIGMCLGWFYPTENLFFSMCLPRGHEAELAGFFVYCTQILGWLPPLVFSILVENNINQRYGVIAVACFFFPAIGVLFLTAPWDGIVAEVAGAGELEQQETMEQGYPSVLLDSAENYGPNVYEAGLQ